MSTFFDPPIERRGKDSAKWNRFASKDRDVIGAWVADMDLPTSDKIIAAVKDRLDERVFGYATAPKGFFNIVRQRLEAKYGWKTKSEWFVVQPGVVPSLFFATNCLGNSGDGVMAARPNYHYFLETAALSDRVYQPVDCHLNGNRWEMDFDKMVETISPKTCAFLLCNPSNPVGRVLDKQELESVAQACLSNGTMICSDEIHAELVLDEDKHHIPIASLDPEIENNSITLFSAAKAFNLPGIGGLSFAIIPNPEIRKAFAAKSYGIATHSGSLAYAATMAAYSQCDDWLAETVSYLRGNRDYLQDEIAKMNGLSMAPVEASFLAWIDASTCGLEDPIASFLEGGVALSGGAEMGRPEFIRLNYGCHRSTLEEMIKRMKVTLAC